MKKESKTQIVSRESNGTLNEFENYFKKKTMSQSLTHSHPVGTPAQKTFVKKREKARETIAFVPRQVMLFVLL